MSVEVTFPDSLVPHLRWWTDRDNTLLGVPFHPEPPSVTLTTDASDEGWGGAHRRQVGGRQMGEGGSGRTHQSPGTQGSVQVPEEVSTGTSRHYSVGPIGQHDSGGIYKQRRGNEIPLSLSVDSGSVSVVQVQQHSCESLTSARETKSPGRQLISGENQPDRMGAKQRDCEGDLSSDRKTTNRFVCLGKQRNSPDILHSVPSSSGALSGCVQYELDEHPRLCLPTHMSDQKGAGKDGSRALQTTCGSSLMASSALVSATSQSSSRASLSAAAEGGPNVPEGNVVSSAGKPTFDCLAAVKRSFQQKGLSEQAAALAAHSRRESTFRV